MDRRINQLNRQLYERRMKDLANDRRNHTTVWITKLNGMWKVGSIRLKNQPTHNQHTHAQ
jgi:hypothetical protein